MSLNCVHSPGDMSMENHGEMIRTGELLIHPPECSLAILPPEPSSGKSEGTWRRR
jgi:hypothetical protein